MEHAHRAAVPAAQEAAQLGIAEFQRGILTPCDFRIGFPDRHQLPVVPQDAAGHPFQVLYGIGRLLVIGAPFRILHGIPVSPEHRQAAVRVCVRSAPGTPQADLLTVVDEGRPGRKNIQIGRHLHPAARHGQVSGRPVGVVIGDEGNVHGSGVRSVDGIEIALRRLDELVDVPGLRGLRDEAVRLGGGEMKAVERLQIPVGDTVAVPDLRHGINVRIDLFQLVHIPGPEFRVFRVIAVIRILGGVKPEPVNPQAQPVRGHVHHRFPDFLVVKIQFRHAV